MSYIVTVTHNGREWPLRGTVIAFSMERAQKFATREEAVAALAKAKKFMAPKVFRTAVVHALAPEIGDQPYGT
jgi:hypothetical protein